MEQFNIIYPSLALSPYIKHYWILEIDSNMQVGERTLATGNMQLIFHRKERLFSTLSNDFQPQAFISGQSSGYSDVASDGNLSMIVVVFRPYGIKALFPMSMMEFQNKNIPVEDIGDNALKELGKKIMTTHDNTKCIELIEEFLLKRINGFNDFNFKRVYNAIQLINQQIDIKISNLAQSVYLSQKQFNRVFTDYVGTSPKEFARIVRFQQVLYMLEKNAEINLTQLAADCGFYDQPHFIKEFKTLSGYTPSEFLAICQPHSDYFG